MFYIFGLFLSINFFKDLFIDLFLAALGCYCFALAFCSGRGQGLLFVAGQQRVVVAHGLSCSVACRGSSPIRDQTCVPALAGRFLAARPPGKALSYVLYI